MSYLMRTFVSLLMGALLVPTLISCSSSSPEEEWAGEDSFFGEEDQAIVEGTGGDEFSDFEDFEDFEDFDSMEIAEEDMDFSDFDDFDGGEDALAQELGDQSLSDDDFFFEEPADEFAETDAAFADPLADDAFGADAFADNSFEAPVDGGADVALPVDPLASVDEFDEPAADNFVPLEGDDFGTDLADTGFPQDANAMMGLVPVKKIDTMPRYRAGDMLNAVYIARPGDTVESISQKIYGEDRTSDIVTHNPWLSDGIKVGEKLYYNSPNRPSDNTALLTYYEDVGAPAKTYITGDSENIRTLSRDLLGFEGAWKEVYATNLNVNSKDILLPATELKYWTEVAPTTPAPSMPTLAQNGPPAADILSLGMGAPSEDGMGMEPAPLPDSLTASSDLPPPPAAPPGASFDEFPEYAPSEFEDPVQAQAPMPVEELNLPPPPPAPQSGLANQSSSSAGDSGTTTMLLMGLGGLALVLLLVSLAKKRRPVSMEYTQV